MPVHAHTHTQKLGRTPLDEGSALSRTSMWHHTRLTTDRNPHPSGYLKLQSQQKNSHRPTPEMVQPREVAQSSHSFLTPHAQFWLSELTSEYIFSSPSSCFLIAWASVVSIVVLRSSSLELFSVLPSIMESRPVVVEVRSVVSKPNTDAPTWKKASHCNTFSLAPCPHKFDRYVHMQTWRLL